MSEDNQLVLSLSDDNFKEQVLDQKETLFLIDFWAVWCGPCQITGPIIDSIADDFKDNSKIKVGKVNVDESLNLSEEYEIRSIPTLKFFYNGQPVAEILGAMPKEIIVHKIEELLKNHAS